MTTAKAKTSWTMGEVWDKLSAINVNEHTQQKKAKTYTLTYLSWSWAWGIMMEHFPDLKITWHGERDWNEGPPDVFYYEGGTAMVACTVLIPNPDGKVDLQRHMWLSVMDYSNNAISHPDSRAISDAKMRCLVKCFAMFGLGHYIYAGEDVPQSPDGRTEAEQEIEDLITEIKTVGRATKAAGIDVSDTLTEEATEAIKGRTKGKLTKVVAKLKALDK